jgi:hypothetical protein
MNSAGMPENRYCPRRDGRSSERGMDRSKDRLLTWDSYSSQETVQRRIVNPRDVTLIHELIMKSNLQRNSFGSGKIAEKGGIPIPVPILVRRVALDNKICVWLEERE